MLFLKSANRSCLLRYRLGGKQVVILVASRAFCAKMFGYDEEAYDVAKIITDLIIKLFNEFFDVVDEVFVLDCHDADSLDMDQSRSILCIKRIEILEGPPSVKPPMVIFRMGKFMTESDSMEKRRSIFQTNYWDTVDRHSKESKLLTKRQDFSRYLQTFIFCIGRRFICRSETDMFSPKFFPQLLTRLHAHFTSLGYPPTGIWKDAIKVQKDLECLVQISDRTLNIIVRCEKNDLIGECYKLFEMATYDVYQILHEASPGAAVDLYIISTYFLKVHDDITEVTVYSLQQVCDAEDKKSPVVDEKTGIQEKITDLMIPGYDHTILKEKGLQSDIKWMLKQARQEITKLLEVKKPDGRDHRLLAKHIGILPAEQEAMAANVSSLKKYVTEQLLDKWSENWEEMVRKGGASARYRATDGDVFYESCLNNLLKVNKKYIQDDRVELAITDMIRTRGGNLN
ncbi:uncharacterized protein LOC144350689 [Saccoglossus kowalevskii]